MENSFWVKWNINDKEYDVNVECLSKYNSLRFCIGRKFNLKIKGPIGTDAATVSYFFYLNKKKIIKLLEKFNIGSLFNLNENFISFFGKKHELILLKHNLKKDKYEIGYRNITIYLRNEIDKEKIVRKIYKKESARYIIKRTQELAEKYNFEVNKIDIKWLSGSWGYCKSFSKEVVLSARLIAFEKEVIDYVIIHELCHLIQANHSPEFWKLVGKHCPKYKEIKKQMWKF